jgi:hypothetical protein
MATLYARTLTYAPLSVPSHQWDVRSVLEIHVEKQCIGWAPSQRRKCTCAISYQNWESLKSLTHKIGKQPPDAEQLRSQLERLAYLGLCVRFHRDKQVASMVEKWTPKIDAVARAAEHARRSTTTSTSTPDSPLTPRSTSRQPSQGTQAIPTATSDSASSPERIQPVAAVTPTSATPSGLPSPRATPPPGPASPTTRCTRSHARRRSLGDECPICYEGEPLSALPASALTWCTSSCGRAVHTTCFTAWAEQSVLSGWKLNCPVCRADWTESCACGGRSNCDAVHVARKGMEVPCPVCKEDMKGSGEGTSWCKDGCGQSVHKECMDTWKAYCLTNRNAVSCTMCRAVWTSECEC